MEKIIINVPKTVRFISDWSGFELPENPSIINKQITGCGFTEWCIRNKRFTVLCSPRKILLENKSEQHPGEVFYVKNDLDKVLNIDRDLSQGKPDIKRAREEMSTLTLSDEELQKYKEAVEKMKEEIYLYYFNCIQSSTPCKILTTYDSFRHVKDALGERIGQFDIIVDEFQSIFTDSKFKSDTELEFLNHLYDLKKVYFVSATPMIDDYLEMLDEFKDLPYYELDWKAENPNRVIKPQLDIIPCQRILDAAERFIKPYLEGNFEKSYYIDEDTGEIKEVESRELVIYVNSVKNICDIIRRNGLTYENTNVLCARTSENKQKIRKAFGFRKKGDPSGIGKVPKRDDPHKMFTLCTRTVYLGADFYSTCAKTLILSDANIDSLAVDITLDLPQILGRQRLLENPWKNRATLYYRSILKKNEKTIDEFKKYLNTKVSKTESLLRSYNNALSMDKHALAEKFKKGAASENYRDDFVAVNVHAGKDLKPVFNNLVMVSELRAFQIQQIDYKDRFSVFRAVSDEYDEDNKVIIEFLDKFESLSLFPDKMRLLCETKFNDDELKSALELVPIMYKNYYISYGKAKLKSVSYRKSLLDREEDKKKELSKDLLQLPSLMYDNFKPGDRYTKSDIKEKLRFIYFENGIKLSPKASDLDKYFEIKSVSITNKESGKRENGFEIIKKKEDTGG